MATQATRNKMWLSVTIDNDVFDWIEQRRFFARLSRSAFVNLTLADLMEHPRSMLIEEHLDHWDMPTKCVDPDNCPVVYAMIMNEVDPFEHK